MSDNYAEYYVPLKNDLAKLINQMEHEDYAAAIETLEDIVTNARLLYVWTKGKTHEDSMELQRPQDVLPVPTAVPRGEGT